MRRNRTYFLLLAIALIVAAVAASLVGRDRGAAAAPQAPVGPAAASTPASAPAAVEFTPTVAPPAAAKAVPAAAPASKLPDTDYVIVEATPDAVSSTAAPAGTARVFGTIMDENGVPVTGVRVWIGAEKEGLAGGIKPKLQGMSGKDGGYEISELPAGNYMLGASAPRHKDPGVEKIEVAEGAGVRHDVKLERGMVISGRVQDASGNPLGGIEIKNGYPQKTTQSADDGTFELGGLDPQWKAMSSVSTNDPAGRYAPWRGKAANGMTITLEAAARLDCRVVRRGSGEPVEGASLRVTPAGAAMFGMWDAPTTRETDASGACAFEGLAPGTVRLDATRDGLAPGSADVEVSAGSHADATIELVEGGTIAGRVVGADGRPVAGALVADGTTAGKNPGLAMIGTEGLLAMMADQAGGPEGEAFTKSMKKMEIGEIVTSDADGRFRLEHVPPGTRKLAAAASGRVPATVAVTVPDARGSVETTITLGSGGAIEGTARKKDGAPAAGAQVMFQSMSTFTPRQTKMGDDGRYRVEGLRAGAYMAIYQDPDAEQKKQPGFGSMKSVTVVEGQTARCDFGPQRGATVAGTVRVAGQPLASREIYLMKPGRGMESMKGAMTEADGRYRLEDVAPGRYEVFFAKLAHRPLDVPDGASEVPFDVDLPALSIAGHVVDGDGRPLGGATVRAVRASDTTDPFFREFAADGTSDETGAFRIDELDAQTYVLTATHQGFAPARAEGVDARAPAAVTLRLSRGGKIKGHVIGPEGEAVADAMLVVEDAAGNRLAGSMESWQNMGREPEADGVPAGVYTVSAVTLRGSFDRKAGVRFDGTELTLEFALGPGGTLEAAARDRASGRLLEGARVDITYPDGAPLPSVFFQSFFGGAAGSDGVIRREKLPGGPYRGKITLEGGRAASFDFTIVEEKTTRVTVDVP